VVVPTAELTWARTTGTDVYDFGTITAWETPSQTFTLTDTGRRSSGTLSVELTGSSAFTITADACTGSALGGGQSCDVSVRYAPTTPGQSDEATLTATGEHGVSASLTLTGAAVPPAHIYWTDVNSGTIGQATIAGTS
jgi:hypothetical protein